MKNDTSKGIEAMQQFLQKTSDAGKQALLDIQKKATALSEQAKQDSYNRRIKKYNPLFPEVYHSSDFCVPNMIVIVDDAVRRDIDVCEGAIGWRSTENGLEVLYLYDEAVKDSGLSFIPSVTCDAVYYVDSFNHSRYIRIDCFFSKAHEERLAELKNVAHALGAKSCSIELSESTQQYSTFKRNTNGSMSITSKGSIQGKSDQSSTCQSNHQRSGRIVVQFEGNNVPHRPKLKWFAHDENIKKLIEMRCKGDNTIRSETLELSGASSATMSQKTACAIDGAVGKIGGFKGQTSMETQAVTENTSKLIFCIEF